jgi:prefoldin subunit 5
MNFPNENLIQKKDKISKLLEENKKVSYFISNLNKNLTHEVLVPILDNLAFLPGKIINTNECNVYLGEDLFAHTTNFRALKILENRGKKLNSLLSDLNQQISSSNKEEKLPVNLKKLDDDTIEIIETFVEENKQLIVIQNDNIDLKIRQKLDNLSKSGKSILAKEKLFEIEQTNEIKSIKKNPPHEINVQQKMDTCQQTSKRSHFFQDEEENYN